MKWLSYEIDVEGPVGKWELRLVWQYSRLSLLAPLMGDGPGFYNLSGLGLLT